MSVQCKLNHPTHSSPPPLHPSRAVGLINSNLTSPPQIQTHLLVSPWQPLYQAPLAVAVRLAAVVTPL